MPKYAITPVSDGARIWRRPWIWLVLILIGLVALIPAYYWAEKAGGTAAWRAYEAEARQRCVKLDRAAYFSAEVSDDENFANTPILNAAFRASEQNRPIPNPFAWPPGSPPRFNDSPRLISIDLAAWRKFFVETGLLSSTSNSAAWDVLVALDGYSAPLEELRRAAARPHGRFPVKWEKGPAAVLPHLPVIQGAARVYALRASAHLALGESAGAYHNFKNGLRLATAMADEPSVLSGLTRLSIIIMMQNCVWGGLATQKWAEPELEKIRDDLASLDWRQDCALAMGSERCGMNQIYDLILDDPRVFDNFLRSHDVRGFSTLKPAGWFLRDRVRMNRFMDRVLTGLEPGQFPRFGDPPGPGPFMDVPAWTSQFRIMPLDVFAPVMESSGQKYVRAGVMTDHARLACALELFRLAHGSYPADLAALAPKFIASVPVDIVNGQPYRYGQTHDGRFLLYSVGLDLRDDGGVADPALGAASQKDWAWRYPPP